LSALRQTKKVKKESEYEVIHGVIHKMIL